MMYFVPGGSSRLPTALGAGRVTPPPSPARTQARPLATHPPPPLAAPVLQCICSLTEPRSPHLSCRGGCSELGPCRARPLERNHRHRRHGWGPRASLPFLGTLSGGCHSARQEDEYARLPPCQTDRTRRPLNTAWDQRRRPPSSPLRHPCLNSGSWKVPDARPGPPNRLVVGVGTPAGCPARGRGGRAGIWQRWHRASEQHLEGGSLCGRQEGDGRTRWGCPRAMLIKPPAGKHHHTRSFLQESCAVWIYGCAERILITTF